MDNAMSQYLQRLLGPGFENKYSITVIDSTDINKAGLSEDMAKKYILASKANLIIVLETEDRSASFTVVKDSREPEVPTA